MIRWLVSILSPEERERREKEAAAESVREAFDACFGHFDGPIQEGRRRHGSVNKALKAKQDAVHAALARKAA